ncbi:hypothetical protein BS50DRAFT_134696 [Corynespora cassiicola Philippines]|uniref:Uncharacterized protein n=1 Tax=Corynespora cassiicola Philippines TaxID=1448308 RepID=A0A2T2N986_CORCC|nr:hypothetical protein BS50DRAFT_134696 [Corynespora cassiicola Philippines]
MGGAGGDKRPTCHNKRFRRLVRGFGHTTQTLPHRLLPRDDASEGGGSARRRRRRPRGQDKRKIAGLRYHLIPHRSPPPSVAPCVIFADPPTNKRERKKESPPENQYVNAGHAGYRPGIRPRYKRDAKGRGERKKKNRVQWGRHLHNQEDSKGEKNPREDDLDRPSVNVVLARRTSHR